MILSFSWSLPVSAWPSFGSGSGKAHVPAEGRLLVAMPAMKDPHFKNAVILLVRHNASGAIGLIINRRTRLTLASEFENMVSEPLGEDSLFWGGPVAMNRRVMLVERERDEGIDKPQQSLLERLYFANSLQQFQAVLKQDQPLQRFRVYAGYAGWGANQLEHEIIRGDWIVIPGSVDLVLQSDTESIWPQLIHYRHGLMAATGPTALVLAQRP
jgi:putative transcriptional regulator